MLGGMDYFKTLLSTHIDAAIGIIGTILGAVLGILGTLFIEWWKARGIAGLEVVSIGWMKIRESFDVEACVRLTNGLPHPVTVRFLEAQLVEGTWKRNILVASSDTISRGPSGIEFDIAGFSFCTTSIYLSEFSGLPGNTVEWNTLRIKLLVSPRKEVWFERRFSPIELRECKWKSSDTSLSA